MHNRPESRRQNRRARYADVPDRAPSTLTTTHPKTLASTVIARAPIATKIMAWQARRPTRQHLHDCPGSVVSRLALHHPWMIPQIASSRNIVSRLMELEQTIGSGMPNNASICTNTPMELSPGQRMRESHTKIRGREIGCAELP